MRAGDLRDVDERWAAIVLWHSLEHLRDPGDVVAPAAGLLAERGVLVMAMPNAASLQARAFGDRWFALDLPLHLVHVPAAALVGRLEALGLRVERVSHARGGQIAFGPDGRLASASMDTSVRIWNPELAQQVHAFFGHTGEVFSVAFGAGGKLLASAAKDGTVRLPTAHMQPIAADDLAAGLAVVAVAAPANGVIEVAGPDRLPMDELARRVLAANGDRETVPLRNDNAGGPDFYGEIARLPGCQRLQLVVRVIRAIGCGALRIELAMGGAEPSLSDRCVRIERSLKHNLRALRIKHAYDSEHICIGGFGRQP